MKLLRIASRVADLIGPDPARDLAKFVDRLEEQIREGAKTGRIPRYEQMVEEKLKDNLNPAEIKIIVDYLEAYEHTLPESHPGISPEEREIAEDNYSDHGHKWHDLMIKIRNRQRRSPDFHTKFKAKKDDAEVMAIIKRDPKQIKWVEDPPEELQLEAVSKDPSVIKLIENPAERAELIAFKRGYLAKNPCEKVQIAIVSHNPKDISEIYNPTIKVQMMAVKEDPSVLAYIEDPKHAVVMEAIREIEEEAVNELWVSRLWNDEQELALVKKYPNSIHIINNPSQTLKNEAMKLDPEVYDDIHRPTPRVQELYGHHSKAF